MALKRIPKLQNLDKMQNDFFSKMAFSMCNKPVEAILTKETFLTGTFQICVESWTGSLKKVLEE